MPHPWLGDWSVGEGEGERRAQVVLGDMHLEVVTRRLSFLLDEPDFMREKRTWAGSEMPPRGAPAMWKRAVLVSCVGD